MSGRRSKDCESGDKRQEGQYEMAGARSAKFVANSPFFGNNFSSATIHREPVLNTTQIRSPLYFLR